MNIWNYYLFYPCMLFIDLGLGGLYWCRVHLELRNASVTLFLNYYICLFYNFYKLISDWEIYAFAIEMYA